ncbi:MAG: ABC transporter ATP-binding protein [Nitrospirae bacterium]|nr:ABC transporter ATP-binding protein [Nitrospirota bacterium]
MLKLVDIHTFYGPIEALRGINLEVKKGEIVCLIGSNGAGKSTTLMTISGVKRPQKGSIIFEDMEIHKLPSHKIVRMGISHVPEGRRIFPWLTVRENLEMGAFVKKLEGFDFVYNLFPVLKEREKQLGGTLSGGEQQMLAIARALMGKPRLMLLDEPSLGLAPVIMSKIIKTVKELNQQGITILIVEQNAKAALKIAHRGYVIESGRITKEGEGKKLLDDPDIKKAYLGE